MSATSLGGVTSRPTLLRTLPRLQVTTRTLPDSAPLTEWISPRDPLVFARRGHGLVGRGRVVTATFSGPDRIHQASAWWKTVSDDASIEDRVNGWGTGLVGFGAMTFATTSDLTSVLVIPRVIIGRNATGAWRTDITVAGEEPGNEGASEGADEHNGGLRDVSTDTGAVITASTLGPLESLDWRPGKVSREHFVDMVNTAVEQLSLGRAHKVVLARDLVAQLDAATDWREAISRLTTRYPDTHTFAIDGLVGASPETLVSLRDTTLHTRVLAGSTARGGDESADQAQADALYSSTKDLDEHRFAVHSAVEALKTLTPHVVADELPFTLKLPNLWHLATDIAATLPAGSTALDAVAALHPTAAVAGSPRNEALNLIAELEPIDRGRYAGPVGWVNHRGEGEWAIALRCAQWSADHRLTAYAGAGIVKDSSAESELLETDLKFQPIIDAFG